LESLSLSRSGPALVPEVTQLPNLERLLISSTHIRELPESIGNLTKLTELSARGNNLTRLPASIGELHNLETLNLRENDLTALPSAFGDLESLVDLNLALNDLRSLPRSMGQLTNLQTLDLSNNELRTVPSEMTALTNLTSLDLASNNLLSLPSGFVDLADDLEVLDLRGNPAYQMQHRNNREAQVLYFADRVAYYRIYPNELAGSLQTLLLQIGAVAAVGVFYWKVIHGHPRRIPVTLGILAAVAIAFVIFAFLMMRALEAAIADTVATCSSVTTTLFVMGIVISTSRHRQR
ncbi:MAG: leucine-rich repeat domain-containing protein, partial [Chloroflexota bacterium]